jgi:head-tail adaptor
MNAGTLTERITLQVHDGVTNLWADVATDPVVSAAVEPQAEERYRMRIRYRADLRSKADTVPAMRVLWRDLTLDVEDVFEFERHQEVHLLVHQRLVEREHLETGTRRNQQWP